MKKQLLVLGLAFCGFSSAKAQSADIEWARGFGATGTGTDNASAIVMDDAGNVYTAGMFTGTTDLDPGPGQFSLTSTGDRDMYIQKLDADGNFVWAVGFQNSESKFASGISVDPNGNVILVGRFRGTVDFDPSAATADLTATALSGIPGSNDDAFIVKLDQNGNYLWAYNFGQINGDMAVNVATDAAGNIYTTGYYTNAVDFNPATGPVGQGDVIPSNGGTDIFLQKLDADGNLIWVKGFGGTGNDQGKSVVVDDNQNIYLATIIASSGVDFDPNDPSNPTLSSAGANDIAIVKLNQAGDHQWSKRIGGSLEDNTWSIDVDHLGNPVLTGIYTGTVDFDPGSGSNSYTSTGGTDMFTLKLDTDGNFEWATSVGSPNADLARWITTDAAGNIYTTGNFRGPVDFDPGAGMDGRVAAGGIDIFVQKLDNDGNYVWTKTIGSSGDDYGLSLDHNAGGELVISGYFTGTVDFEDGTGVTNLVSTGGKDAYVVKYFECASQSSTDVISACGSYEWINGTTYTSSNSTAQVTLTNQAGCDSIVSLDLTITQSDATTDVISACGSYEWINGTTYTSSNNTAQVTLTNQAGCDSIVTLDLTINQPDATTDVITACGSYEWIDGTTYTSSNSTAQVTLTNQAGCDSIVTLDLTINQPDATTDVITACGSYEWIDGTTYTSSNSTAQVTLTNQAGCDSIVTLDLTINQPDAITDVISACGSYEWIDGTTYTSSNSTAQVTFTNQAGCDSVVTLDLTINQPDATTDVITACDSYEWIDGTTYTASNNTAQVTLTNQAGCDSIVTLDLTINSVGVTSVMSTGNTISASNSGATFQWVDCDDNFAPITGETGSDFTAASTGNYAVEVTNNGCTEISNCVSIMVTSLNDQPIEERISIYPQPSNGEFNINLGGLENVSISIYSSNGQLVHQNASVNASVYSVQLNQPAGLYVMLLEAENKSARFKIVLR